MAGHEGGRGGRENITPVEGRRHFGGHRQGHHGAHAPESVGRGWQQAVVGADEKSPWGGHRDCPARGAHPRVDDRKVHRGWQVAERLGEHDRSPPHVTGRYEMGDVDDANARRPT